MWLPKSADFRSPFESQNSKGGEKKKMDILLTLIFGAIVGVIASFLMGSSTGLVTDIVLGVIGALIGSFIMNIFGQTGVTGFNFYSMFVSVLGAVVVIALARMFYRRSVV